MKKINLLSTIRTMMVFLSNHFSIVELNTSIDKTKCTTTPGKYEISNNIINEFP